MTITWLAPGLVEAIHEEQIAEHGGAEGIRDLALLSSALGRPRQAAAYGQKTIYDLAALLLVGLVKNHPFVDGNKRVGLVATYAFLSINGYKLNASEEQAYIVVMDIASGDIDEHGAARWIEDNSVAL